MSNKPTPLIDKRYASLEKAAILKAPVHALHGVTEDDAVALQKIGVHTIEDLANNKFVRAAQQLNAIHKGGTPAVIRGSRAVVGADIGAMTQYDWMFNALATKFPGIAVSNGGKNAAVFQFMSTPTNADWVTGSDATAYALADATSLSLGGFFSPGDHLSQAYASFVMSLAPSASAQVNADYRNAVIQLAALDNAQLALAGKAKAAYAVDNANAPGRTWAEWLADPFGGKVFNGQLNQNQMSIDNFTATMAAITAAIDGPLGAAQKAVNPFNPSMNVSIGGTLTSVAEVEIEGNLASDVQKWTARPAGEFDFDVTMKSSDTIVHPWTTTSTVETTVNCWGASTETQVNTSRIIADTNYSLRVQAVGVNTYQINRGPWFDPALVKSTAAIVEGSAYTNDSFFGVNGTLHLIPESIFVMFRPRVQLTMSTDIYKQEIDGKFDANITWIDIMGFRFNISGKSSLQPVGDEVTTTITLDSPTNQAAFIVGITSNVISNDGT